MNCRIPYRTGRVAILSDLHIDSYMSSGRDVITSLGFETVIKDDLDALIIAGDLSDGPAARWGVALGQLAPHIAPSRIYIFPGNHDYFGGMIEDDNLLAQQTQAIGAHWAQRQKLYHGNTRFLCCTLWTDFDLLGDQNRAMNIAHRTMRDYERIRKNRPVTPGSGFQSPSYMPQILPSDTVIIHNEHKAWLESQLLRSHPARKAGRTVIVTHHGPHLSTAGPVDGLTPAFHSDMTNLIDRFAPDAWFFGHSHRRLRTTVGRTDLRNVSAGYCGEFHRSESKNFIETCIWES
ncbi:metallophosphoesterase family protein [Sulfitobacter dubius]|uniref:3',5'-cyclic adenosine monophosphate phosphodiesterase CpdA n=1 Tax=Sulfitobacter dubius TaxID=218673 RepID=A0ABY3ZQJ9_9RHOB|nr:metallophosphoesterase [Sulfitobacter dubius]UOA16900.1 3',5'-cyclic adenosine monophosphate phosphodiesterase CpdA [Sulfitobacter dubius]